MHYRLTGSIKQHAYIHNTSATKSSAQFYSIKSATIKTLYIVFQTSWTSKLWKFFCDHNGAPKGSISGETARYLDMYTTLPRTWDTMTDHLCCACACCIIKFILQNIIHLQVRSYQLPSIRKMLTFSRFWWEDTWFWTVVPLISSPASKPTR